MPRVPEGYTKDWPEISKSTIENADNHCEECGIKNGIIVRRKGSNKRQIVPEEEYNSMFKKFSDAQEIVDRKYHEERARVEREWLDDFFSGNLNVEELGLGHYAEGEFIPFDDAMGFFENGVFHFTGLPPEKDVEFEDLFPTFNWTRIVLQVHHKDRNKKNNDSSNLIALCQHCHGAKHPPRLKSIGSSRR